MTEWVRLHRSGFWAAGIHWQLMLSFLVHKHPEVFLPWASLDPFSTQPVLVLELPRPKCRTLYLALLNFLRFAEAHFSSPSETPWMLR